MAEIPPVFTARSVCDKICSLYFAVKLRRFGPAVNSAEATIGPATMGPEDDGVEGSEGEEVKEVGRRSGITVGSISCALECKLQTVKCLTLVGTEGGAPCSAGRRIAWVACKGSPYRWRQYRTDCRIYFSMSEVMIRRTS